MRIIIVDWGLHWGPSREITIKPKGAVLISCMKMRGTNWVRQSDLSDYKLLPIDYQ